MREERNEGTMNDTDGTRLSFFHPSLPRLEPTIFNLDAYFPGRLFWKWAWIERYDLDSCQYAELEAKGWQLIPRATFPSVFLPLSSQLFEILGVYRLEQPQTGDPLQDFTLWARRRDCQSAQNYPVVLVAEMMWQDRVTSSKLAKLAPGSQAILFTGSDAVHRYTLRDLGEQGAALWEQIKDGLREEQLAFSNHQRGILLPYAERQRRAEAFTRLVQGVLERYERGRLAAAELARCYWHHHQQSPNKPVRLPQTIADIPLGFRQVSRGQGYPIPVTLGLEAVLLALSNAAEGAADWREEERQPTYHLVRETGEASVTIPEGAVRADTQQDITRKLWARISEIEKLDGDVLLALIIHAILVGPDERGGIWISAADILNYRGIVPKQHTTAIPGVMRDAGHRPEDICKVAECIQHLRAIHTTVCVWHEPKKKGGRRRVVGQESYLFTVSDFLEDRTDGEDPSLPRQQIAWYYRLGEVLGNLPRGKRIRAAWLLQTALRYDPVRRGWEKRLARYFLFHLRMNNAFGGATMKRSIRSMIQENSLPLNEGSPEKTKTRFEKALSRLKEDGHIDSWPERQYREAMAKRPAHHWLNMWLDYEMEITAVPLLSDLAEESIEGLKHRQSPK
jgi:hypothetical protein